MSGASILIAGAGYTGNRLAARLAADGRPVALSSRRPATDTGAAALAADLDRPIPDSGLADWAQNGPLVLVYLVPPADDDTRPDDRRLRHLLQALGALPQRIVLASTSGVYGDREGRVTDETTPVNPQTARAKRRVRLERTLAECGAASTVVLRIAGIYGPGRLPVAAIRRGDPIISPTEAGPGNRIHVDDLVTTCVAAIDHPEPPALVNVADGDHTTSSAFTLAVAAALGLPAPELISRREAQQRLSAARLSFLNESRRLATDRLRDALGVELAYPDHRDGIAASLSGDQDPIRAASASS